MYKLLSLLLLTLLQLSYSFIDSYPSGVPGASGYIPSDSEPNGTIVPSEDSTSSSVPAVSCPYAVKNANQALARLITDLRDQVSEWIIYSDLDTVNEISYFLKNTCDVNDLKLNRVGDVSQDTVQEQACGGLQALLQDILEQKNTKAFRGGIQSGRDTAVKGLELGKQLGDTCQFELVSDKIGSGARDSKGLRGNSMNAVDVDSDLSDHWLEENDLANFDQEDGGEMMVYAVPFDVTSWL